MDGRVDSGDKSVASRTSTAREPVFDDIASDHDVCTGDSQPAVRSGLDSGTPTPVSFVHHFIDYMGLHAAGRVDAGVGGTPGGTAFATTDERVPDVDLGGGSSNTDVVVRMPKKLKWLITVVAMGIVYAAFEVIKLVKQ